MVVREGQNIHQRVAVKKSAKTSNNGNPGHTFVTCHLPVCGQFCSMCHQVQYLFCPILFTSVKSDCDKKRHYLSCCHMKLWDVHQFNRFLWSIYLCIYIEFVRLAFKILLPVMYSHPPASVTLQNKILQYDLNWHRILTYVLTSLRYTFCEKMKIFKWLQRELYLNQGVNGEILKFLAPWLGIVHQK